MAQNGHFTPDVRVCRLIEVRVPELNLQQSVGCLADEMCLKLACVDPDVNPLDLHSNEEGTGILEPIRLRSQPRYY